MQTQNDVAIKGYDSTEINFIPNNAKFLAESDNGNLEVIFVDSINTFNLELTKSGSTYKPKYIYLVDFVVKFDFLAKPEFRKSFNFMEKYKFKQIELVAYDPYENKTKVQKSFVAELQIEELFAFTKKFVVLEEPEDRYVPILDRISFNLSVEYLEEMFKFKAEEFGKNLNGKSCEIDSSSYYDLQELEAAALAKEEISPAGNSILFSMI